MRIVSLFSGMEMMGLGFQQAGFELVASNELDPTICKTIERNFDHDILCVSAHKLSAEDLLKDYRRIDGIIGGFPCTVYSTAADIHRTRVCGSNIRLPRKEKIPTYSRYAELGGDLFLHYFRIVANLQPEFFVVENVPGLLNARIVRETFRKTPCGKSTLGYYYVVFEGILNAVDFGLPQNRPRYFFIGSRKNGIMNIQYNGQGRHLMVGDILEQNPDVHIPDYVQTRLQGVYRDPPIITEAGYDSVAPTCVAHYAKDRSTRLIKIGDIVRPYSVKEWARLQGVPDSIEIAGSEYYQYLQVGNAVPVTVAHSIANAIRMLYN